MRELGIVGKGNFPSVNRTVSAALAAGAEASEMGAIELDAYNCGELRPLRALNSTRVHAVFWAAVAAGQLDVLVQLCKVWNEECHRFMALRSSRGIASSSRPDAE